MRSSFAVAAVGFSLLAVGGTAHARQLGYWTCSTGCMMWGVDHQTGVQLRHYLTNNVSATRGGWDDTIMPSAQMLMALDAACNNNVFLVPGIANWLTGNGREYSTERRRAASYDFSAGACPNCGVQRSDVVVPTCTFWRPWHWDNVQRWGFCPPGQVAVCAAESCETWELTCVAAEDTCADDPLDVMAELGADQTIVVDAEDACTVYSWPAESGAEPIPNEGGLE